MKLYILLVLSTFFNNLLIFVILPFFPLISKEKNISISLIGIILTISSVGSAVAILLIKYFKDSNPIKVIIKSNITLQIAICVLGFLNNIQSNYVFSTANAIVLFFIGGITTFDLSYIYGTVGLIYKKNLDLKNRRYALAKLIGNSGNIFGSLIAGILYKYFGYSGMFCIISGIYFLITILFTFLLRNEFNQFNEESFHEEQKYELKKIYFDIKIFLSFFFLLSIGVVGQIFRPGFGIHLKDSFNIENSEISYYFSFFGIGTTIGNFVVIVLLSCCREVSLIKLSFFLGIIGLIIIGPTTFIGLPLNLYLILFALGLLGFSKSFINIPNFNFLFNILINEEKFNLSEKNANFIASFINEFIFAFSGVVGPFIGGFLTDYLKFANGMFCYSMFCSIMFFGIIIFIKFFKFDKVNRRRRQKTNSFANIV